MNYLKPIIYYLYPKTSNWGDLQPELLQNIFSYLKPECLLKIRCICKKWMKIASDYKLWEPQTNFMIQASILKKNWNCIKFSVPQKIEKVVLTKKILFLVLENSHLLGFDVKSQRFCYNKSFSNLHSIRIIKNGLIIGHGDLEATIINVNNFQSRQFFKVSGSSYRIWGKELIKITPPSKLFLAAFNTDFSQLWTLLPFSLTTPEIILTKTHAIEIIKTDGEHICTINKLHTKSLVHIKNPLEKKGQYIYKNNSIYFLYEGKIKIYGMLGHELNCFKFEPCTAPRESLSCFHTFDPCGLGFKQRLELIEGKTSHTLSFLHEKRWDKITAGSSYKYGQFIITTSFTSEKQPPTSCIWQIVELYTMERYLELNKNYQHQNKGILVRVKRDKRVEILDFAKLPFKTI